MSRTQVILRYVDMDAFYASVEMARRPELRDVPMYGGAERAWCSAPTIRPGRTASRVACRRPGLVGSARRRSWCRPTTTLTDALAGGSNASSPTRSRWPASTRPSVTSPARSAGWANPGRSANAVRPGHRRTTHPMLGGHRPSKFIAAGQQAGQPDGLVEVLSDRITAFLHPPPVEVLGGGAGLTASRLHKLGLTSIDDVAHTPKPTLQRAFGATQRCVAARPGLGTRQPVHPGH